MAWTDETKQAAIDAYTAGNPTPGNSTELIKQIADDMEESPNGVRQVLIQARVYVKKDAAVAADEKKAASDKAPRVSKEAQIQTLKNLLESKGAEIDNDILDKLTGKAAAYFTKVLA